jgi:hypothetical protein
MPLCKYSLKHLIRTQFNNITIGQKIKYCLQIAECLEVFEKEQI